LAEPIGANRTLVTPGVARGALVAGVGEPFAPSDIRPDELRAGEVLVDVKAAGLCHSDWNFVAESRGNPFPALLGHELAGVVAAVGAGVSELAVGDHVVACGVASCGECDRCMDGMRVFCRHPERTRRGPEERPRLTTPDGAGVWQLMGLGGFANRTVVHQATLVAIDKRVPFDRAALLGCAVVTGAGAVMRCAKVRPRQTVVVLGVGGVGLNAVQAAALVGARKIIAVDVSDDKLALATTFGATHVVNGRDRDAVAAVAELTGGLGVDHAFEMTGLPGPLQDGFRMLGRGGALYIVGLQAPGAVFELPSAEFFRAASVQMVVMGSTNFKIDVPYYAELYLQGRFNLDDLVSRTISLEQLNEGYADVLGGGSVARTVVLFD
jgi:S-(hydroxymethyl)glutathione dehydrogenase/alcohol dehydrogenase